MSATTTKSGTADADADAAKKGGKKKLMIITLAVLLIVGGGAFYYLHSHSGSKSSSTKKAAAPAPVLGTVMDLDPVSVNLAGGHYLKVGISLQEIKGATVASGSRALNDAIAEYSGKSMAALQDPAQNAAIKAALVKTIKKDYDGDVVDIYFTEFVMQ